MRIIRSTKCSTKYMTAQKRQQLHSVLQEYGKVVNVFIDHFWVNGKVPKSKLLKDIVGIPKDSTWFTARLRKVAAREALDMVTSVQEVFQSNKDRIASNVHDIESKIKEIQSRPDSRRNRAKIDRLSCKRKRLMMKHDMMLPHKPRHAGKRMCVSCTIGNLQESKKSTEFDRWLHLSSVGNGIVIDIPINLHKHFKNLEQVGQRLNSYVVTKDYVQFPFEIETGPKKEVNYCLGIDTGINALASTSTGEQFGTDIKECIERVKRCTWGSRGHQKASNALRQRISEVAKEVVGKADLVVVENLKNLCNNTKLKRRLSQNIRRSIGSWNYRYWLNRIEQQCEWNRVSFRTVSPAYTSQRCSSCGHVDRGNRKGEMFLCQFCGHTGNADVNAAFNILMRFLTGKYGSRYKPENLKVGDVQLCLG